MKDRLMELGWSAELADALLTPQVLPMHFDSSSGEPLQPQYQDSTSLVVEIRPSAVLIR